MLLQQNIEGSTNRLSSNIVYLRNPLSVKQSRAGHKLKTVPGPQFSPRDPDKYFVTFYVEEPRSGSVS